MKEKNDPPSIAFYCQPPCESVLGWQEKGKGIDGEQEVLSQESSGNEETTPGCGSFEKDLPLTASHSQSSPPHSLHHRINLGGG